MNRNIFIRFFRVLKEQNISKYEMNDLSIFEAQKKRSEQKSASQSTQHCCGTSLKSSLTTKGVMNNVCHHRAPRLLYAGNREKSSVNNTFR